ncbi:MAG: hypothetical protein ACI88A_002521 [Paraglaciecola sp.]|jgi:uncharacterized protein (TIGR03503 family)
MLKILLKLLNLQLIVLVTACALPIFVWAQQNNAQTTEESKQIDKTPLTELGTEYLNSIVLLQNRFRIDYKVDEITMIFFRKYGSTPVVLVRPDGSKIFQSQADGEDIFWFDTATYDMVSIKSPMPGPWQAVGEILPDSRVMVISDLKLHAEPLPQIIFSGEIIKQTAYLTNAGKPIDYTAFRDVVSLNINFLSTNNPNFNNFGAKTQTIASFEDNGKGMDETPLDGVFTGQFNLAIADGEWTPVFMVSTPMFTREQVDANLMLYPNPIKVSVELDGGGEGFHKLLIDAAREHVDMSTLLIDGKIQFPNGDVQNFSNTERTPEVREHLIVNYEFGVYRIKLTAYGNTIDGREFILDVPEYSFLSEQPKLEAVAIVDSSSPAGGLKPKAPVLVDEKSMPTSTLILIIVGANLFLLCVGGGLIWYITKDKKIEYQHADAVEKPKEKKVGLFARLRGNKKVIKEPVVARPKPAPENTGIIDLSLPKD